MDSCWFCYYSVNDNCHGGYNEKNILTIYRDYFEKMLTIYGDWSKKFLTIPIEHTGFLNFFVIDEKDRHPGKFLLFWKRAAYPLGSSLQKKYKKPTIDLRKNFLERKNPAPSIWEKTILAIYRDWPEQT